MNHLISLVIFAMSSALDIKSTLLEEQLLNNAAQNGNEEQVKNILRNSDIDVNAKVNSH